MLNTHNTSAAQSTKVSNVLLYTHAVQVKEPEVGYIFTSRDFAKGWDSIYFRPNDKILGEARVGMRKLTSPTLVITSHSNSMAFIIASEKTPVYIPSAFHKGKEGYLIAARLAPTVTPEYMFYMCQYEIWRRTVQSALDLEDWKGVGVCNYDPYTNTELTIEPLGIIRNACVFDELPSLQGQKEAVLAAQEQENNGNSHNGPTVADILPALNKYLSATPALFEDGPRRIGLLRELYKEAAGSGRNDEVLQILDSANFKYTENVLTEHELSTLAKHLDTVFDLLINPAEFSWEKTGSYMQPKEVTDFIVSLANFKEGSTVYNPFAGLSSYGISLKSNRIVGEELNPTTWAVAQIRVFANGSNTDISRGDSFLQINSDTTFDAIISSPVVFQEDGKQPLQLLEKLYRKLNDGGELICLIPTNYLRTQSDNSAIILQELLNERAVKSIITLPSNIFVGSAYSQSVVILTKGQPNDVVYFGDASEYTRFSKSLYRATAFDWGKFLRDFKDDIHEYISIGGLTNGCIAAPIPYSELNSTILVPASYLVPVPENGVQLRDIAEIVQKDNGHDELPTVMLNISDIPSNLHDKSFILNPQNNAPKIYGHRFKIDGETVLLCQSKQGLKSVYIQDFNGYISAPVGTIRLLKPKAGVSARYLAALFATKNVADQVKALSKGQNVPRLSLDLLLGVIVPRNESPEEREKLISEVISNEMSEKERELSQRLDMLQTGLRTTRHAMVQTWSALQTNWEELEFFVSENDGHINISDIIGDVNAISVKDMFASIRHSLRTLSNQIDSLKLESVNWGEPTYIDPFGFINRYISRHSSPEFTMVNVGNDIQGDIPWFNDETGESGTEHVDALEMFKAPERKVERIIDNIIANAVAHGFTDPSRKDYSIVFDWKSGDEGTIISIANNGNPLKDGVTGEMVLTRGFTTALNLDDHSAKIHSGQGGFEIKELMEGMGHVRVISQPESELSVIYELTFTDTNLETVIL